MFNNSSKVLKLFIRSMCVVTLLGSALTATYLYYSVAGATGLKGRRESRPLDTSTTSTAMISAEFHSNRSTRSEFGYLLALSHVDQLTGSVANFLSMQCWAKTSLGPRVRLVEPFLRGAVLGIDTAHLDSTKETVRLTDLYDRWNDNAGQQYTPLVSWEHFVENAPRHMIIVDRQCYGKNEGKCMECRIRSKYFLRSVQALTGRYGFEVVRRACYPMKLILETDFRKMVYGNHTPHEVVVLFNSWGGIQKSDFILRLGISDSECNRNRFMLSFPLGKQIKLDAAKYTQKYMPQAIVKGYISVMVRLEQFSIRQDKFQGQSSKQVSSLLRRFYEAIVKKVKRLKADYKVSEVFLTTDCGKHGSGYFSKNSTSEANIMKLMSDSISVLYGMLYGNSSSSEEWEDSHSVSSFQNRGYIAMLQKHLAASGTCLVTAGGGSFQTTAIHLFLQYHPKSRCFYSV